MQLSRKSNRAALSTRTGVFCRTEKSTERGDHRRVVGVLHRLPRARIVGHRGEVTIDQAANLDDPVLQVVTDEDVVDQLGTTQVDPGVAVLGGLDPRSE